MPILLIMLPQQLVGTQDIVRKQIHEIPGKDSGPDQTTCHYVA